MTYIVPLHLLNVSGSVTSPATGFVKLYFKNNILTSKDSTGIENNLMSAQQKYLYQSSQDIFKKKDPQKEVSF